MRSGMLPAEEPRAAHRAARLPSNRAYIISKTKVRTATHIHNINLTKPGKVSFEGKIQTKVHFGSHSGVFSISSSDLTHASREKVSTGERTRGLTAERSRPTHPTLATNPMTFACRCQNPAAGRTAHRQRRRQKPKGSRSRHVLQRATPEPCLIPREHRHRRVAAGVVVSSPGSAG